MTIKTLTLSFFFLCCFRLEALAAWIPGQICTADDTTEVLFKIPMYELGTAIEYRDLQKELKYKEGEGGKIQKLDFSQSVEIRFTHRDEEIRMITAFAQEKLHLLTLLEDGRQRLCEGYMYAFEGGVKYLTKCFCLESKSGSEYIVVNKEGAINDECTEFFGDCPGIVERHLSSGPVYPGILPLLVREYNTICID